MALHHVKPHGALYVMAARNEEVAHAVADAADVYGVPLFGMAGTFHESVYTARGHGFIAEYYCDLAYRGDGGLIITREHVAVDPVDAAARSVRAVREGKTLSVDGNDVTVRADAEYRADSDTPNAVEVAIAVRDAVRPYLEAA